jgi:hypothetical protein
MPKNPMNPQEHPERRHPTSNQWEFYRDNNGYGQIKYTGETQEIPKQQK